MTAQKSKSVPCSVADLPTAGGLAARLAVEELRRREVDPGLLLARCGLQVAALDRRDRIKVVSQIEFLDLASKALRDEYLGFSLAERVDLRELGMLYYVAASSQRLGDALRRLERYVRVANEALIIRISNSTPRRIILAYAGVSRHQDRHHMEFHSLIILRLCRQLVGKKFSALGARFVHHRSSDVRARKQLGCDVQFDANADEIILDAALLDQPVVGEDPFLHELMLKVCEDAIRGRTSKGSAFRVAVETAIAPLLPHTEGVRAKAVAELLNVSERTFARRLASEGVTFGEVLDRLRRDLAIRYLEERDLRVSEIAWLLGFQHPSAFSHACRRWTDKSPQEYRRNGISKEAQGGSDLEQ